MKINNLNNYNFTAKKSKNSTNQSISPIATNKTNNNFKRMLPIAGFTTLGILTPILLLKKTQGAKSLFNIEYGAKEMIGLGTGSVLGGLTGGLIADKGKNSRKKLKEANFQILNIAIPMTITGAVISQIEKHANKFKSKAGKIAALAGAIGAGMAISLPLANFCATKINNKLFPELTEKNRKTSVKDLLVHGDDLAAPVAMLTKNSPIERLIPIFYLNSGIEVGKQK